MAEQDEARRGDRLISTAVVMAWALVLLFQLSVLRPWWPDVAVSNDFIGLWTGASLISRGAGSQLFDLETQRAFQIEQRREVAIHEETRASDSCLAFYNPPPLGLLLAPLTLLPLPTAYIVWAGLSLLAALVAVSLPLRGRPWARTQAALMISYVAVDVTLLEGQANAVYLLAFSLGLMALASGRPLLGGVLMGLLWLKPQYAIIFPLIFLFKRRWRELGGMAISGLALALLSLLLVGTSGLFRLLSIMQQMGSFYPPPESYVNPQHMVNWRSLLMNLWPGIPAATGSALTMALGAATVLASLLAWRGPWEPYSSRFPSQMLVAILATLVASPHSHFHGMVLLLAPVALGLANPPADLSARRQWHRILWAGYIASLLAWPLAPSLLPVQSTKWLLGPGLLVMATILVAKMWTKPVFESHAPKPTK